MKAVAAGSTPKGKGTSSSVRESPPSARARASRSAPGPLSTLLALHHPGPRTASPAPATAPHPSGEHPLEREADRHGAAIAAGMPAAVAGDGSLPPGGLGGGVPLDDRTRAGLERGFGEDLGAIRVHTGPQAAGLAKAAGARSFAAGRDVGFADGHYAPHTREGLSLLGHEVTHVLQQRRPEGRAHVALAPKGAAPPFFDEIDKKVASLPAGHRSLAALQDLLALSKLVDAGSAKDVPAAVTTFLASGRGIAELEFPSTDFSDALISRVFLLGLPDESRRLREFFIPTEVKSPQGRGELTPELRLWSQIVQGVLARAKSGTTADASATITDVVATAGELRKAALALDMKDVGMNLSLSQRHYEDTQFGGAMQGRTSLSGFFFGLRRLQRQLFVAAQKAFQTLMDAAIADLETGTGSVSLDIAQKTLDGKILPLVDMTDAVPWDDNWGPRPVFPEILLPSSEQTVDVTRSTFKRDKRGGAGEHQDIFGASAKKHAPVGFQLYDLTRESGPEKELSLRRIYELRRDQIAFLRKMFASVGGTGKFELHSDDAWRSFLEKKLLERQSLGDDDTAALLHVINLLEEYLHAFTIQSPHDIDDFGDNYLTRTFPRALTGQLIHDCGVYALRIAYALSLVRDKLKLEFRFVRLPSHVALTISGPAIKSAFVFNNNQVFAMSETELAELQAAWAAKSPKGSTDAFFGHLAAGAFIEKVDMPFRVETVPTDPSGAALKNKLWKTFTAQVAKPGVIGVPKDKGLDQFHLQYLSIIEERKRIQNSFAFAIFALWQKHGGTLVQRAQAVNAASAQDATRTNDEYKTSVADYRAALEKVRTARQAAEAELKKKTAGIDDLLAKNPDLVATGAKKAEWQILEVTYRWEKILNDYLAQVDARQPQPDFRFQFPTTD